MTRQLLIRLAVAGLLLAAAWAVLDAVGRPDPTTPDRASQAAVSALVLDAGPAAAQAIPARFETLEHYRPVVADGILLDPGGGCSSPVPLPSEFTPACRRHDLGYDLLRVAARAGGPLPADLRRAVDDQLDTAMHAACADRQGLSHTTCDGWADVASAAVRVNSARQHWSVPGRESPLTVATAATAVATLLTAAAAVLVALRPAAASLVRSVLRSGPATSREVLS